MPAWQSCWKEEDNACVLPQTVISQMHCYRKGIVMSRTLLPCAERNIWQSRPAGNTYTRLKLYAAHMFISISVLLFWLLGTYHEPLGMDSRIPVRKTLA